MKKLILFIAVITFSLGTYAQKIGFRGGYQAAYTNNDGTQTGGALNSFYAGLFTNKDLGKAGVLKGHAGLEYMQNGWYVTSTNFRRIHYISIPMALRAKIGPIYGQGGIGFNFRVGEKFQVAGFDALDDTNKTAFFDIPFHLGVGAKIAFINAEFRYHWGLLDVNQGNKNEYLQLGLGLSF